jgi:drug/metabolite transporter (DMT)-like permease
MILPLLLATLLNGLVGFLYKIAISSGSTPTGILVMQGVVFITCSFIIAIRSGTVGKSRSVLIHAPICGILLGSAFLLLLESLKYGEVSVNFSIVQLSFVITSVLAIFILGEKFRIINFVGIIAAILSVMSFAYL